MRWLTAAALIGVAVGSAQAAPRPDDARLRALAKPWADRFMAERMLGGYGTGRGAIHMDMLVSEPEFRAIAARHRWGPLPAKIKLGFAQGVVGPAVAPTARSRVKVFAHSDRALGATNLALLAGRIELRGGCFYVTGRNQPNRLAYFPREFGITTDRAGALVIRSRLAGGGIIGRIGEEYSWGGPIGLRDDAPMVRELRAQCGQAPIEHVGMLMRSVDFRRRYKL